MYSCFPSFSGDYLPILIELAALCQIQDLTMAQIYTLFLPGWFSSYGVLDTLCSCPGGGTQAGGNLQKLNHRSRGWLSGRKVAQIVECSCQEKVIIYVGTGAK